MLLAWSVIFFFMISCLFLSRRLDLRELGSPPSCAAERDGPLNLVVLHFFPQLQDLFLLTFRFQLKSSICFTCNVVSSPSSLESRSLASLFEILYLFVVINSNWRIKLCKGCQPLQQQHQSPPTFIIAQLPPPQTQSQPQVFVKYC